MTSKRKFYRRIFKIEVLSEEHIPEGVSLEDIGYWITEGHCSGVVKAEDEVEVDGKHMAVMLTAQGSDPEFFQLTSDGEDLDD